MEKKEEFKERLKVLEEEKIRLEIQQLIIEKDPMFVLNHNYEYLKYITDVNKYDTNKI